LIFAHFADFATTGCLKDESLKLEDTTFYMLPVKRTPFGFRLLTYVGCHIELVPYHAIVNTGIIKGLPLPFIKVLVGPFGFSFTVCFGHIDLYSQILKEYSSLHVSLSLTLHEGICFLQNPSPHTTCWIADISPWMATRVFDLLPGVV
jgi:hypothetical protein